MLRKKKKVRLGVAFLKTKKARGQETVGEKKSVGS